MLGPAANIALRYLSYTGIVDFLPVKLVEMRSMASLAKQLFPILQRVKDEPASMASFQSAWRVLPDLMEDAQASGLFKLISHLRAIDSPCLDRPEARPEVVSSDYPLSTATTLKNALPYLLDIRACDDGKADWQACFAAVQARATLPGPIVPGVTQVGSYLAEGATVTLLTPKTIEGAMKMVPSGNVAWCDPGGAVQIAPTEELRRQQSAAHRAAFYGYGDDGLEGGPDEELEEGGPEDGGVAIVWGKHDAAVGTDHPSASYSGEPEV